MSERVTESMDEGWVREKTERERDRPSTCLLSSQMSSKSGVAPD